uniref:DPPIV_N domain-containing protein n=1 Tax=Meloidogyne hapla TaxID=6305 RepID=A0A1I8BBF3_MELHA
MFPSLSISTSQEPSDSLYGLRSSGFSAIFVFPVNLTIFSPSSSCLPCPTNCNSHLTKHPRTSKYAVYRNNRIYENQTQIDDNTWRAHMTAELAGDKVNLSWLDANETLKIRAFNARRIGLISLDWQRPNQPEELSILSAPAPINGATERELSIVADSSTYQ